jgi:hypothetical protein
VNLEDSDVGDQDPSRQQKQLQKRKPTRFSEKIEAASIAPSSGQVGS